MQNSHSRRGRTGSSEGRRRSSSSHHGQRRSFSSGRPAGGRDAHRGGGQRGGGRGGRKIATFDPSQFINKNPVDMVVEAYVPTHTFADFEFNKKIVATVASIGITHPTPIQDQIIPDILNGRDVIGLAETGTGKTAAFLLPLIELLDRRVHRKILILTPTRELALQVETEFRKLVTGFHFYSTSCVGGTSIGPQIRSLKRSNHFVIGTPGRVMDLIERRMIDPSSFTGVVLDEADRMLDMGFIHDMRKILGATPADRQTLFFSATMNAETKKLVNDFLKNPREVSVKKKDVTNSIEQDVVPHGHHNKFETLIELMKNPDLKRVIIFGAMKHSVEKLAQQLSASGILSESIHGNKSHSQRQRALARFKAGQVRVLVATDVAARGIHVDSVSHVINYDLPQTFEDYVHRIGRTGRGSAKGKALTFIPDSH